MSVKEIQSSGNSQERLTRPESAIVNAKPEQAETPIPPTQGQNDTKLELNPSHSVLGGDIQARELYTNWQFLTVFVVSCNLCMKAMHS